MVRYRSAGPPVTEHYVIGFGEGLEGGSAPIPVLLKAAALMPLLEQPAARQRRD